MKYLSQEMKGLMAECLKAVKLLEENMLDSRNIEKVANILGVSDRHLRRVF